MELAKSDIDTVNSLWKGLGYYSRAARLLNGAQKVVKELGGRLPDNAKDMQAKIPGIGRYSAGAICSIAYNQCVPVVSHSIVCVICDNNFWLVSWMATSFDCLRAFWRCMRRQKRSKLRMYCGRVQEPLWRVHHIRVILIRHLLNSEARYAKSKTQFAKTALYDLGVAHIRGYMMIP